MKRDLTELKRLARETLTGHYAAPMAGIVITGAISNLLLLPFDLTLSNSASQSVIFYAASFFIVLLSILFFLRSVLYAPKNAQKSFLWHAGYFLLF